METQAQERLHTLVGLYFMLIDKDAYQQYRREAEQAQDITAKQERYAKMVKVLKNEISTIDVNALMDEHFDNLYFQREIQYLHPDFKGKDKVSIHVKSSLSGIVSLTNFCSAENWLNYPDSFQVKSRTYYLESNYLAYQANRITKEFWFYKPYYNFSYEFLDSLKAQFPAMESVLRMESKHLLPMYLGDDHLTKETKSRPISMEEYDANPNRRVSLWRLSDEVIDYLYRKLTENPTPFQGLIQEDYQLFLEMLRKAKEENCYFVLDFVG